METSVQCLWPQTMQLKFVGESVCSVCNMFVFVAVFTNKRHVSTKTCKYKASARKNPSNHPIVQQNDISQATIASSQKHLWRSRFHLFPNPSTELKCSHCASFSALHFKPGITKNYEIAQNTHNSREHTAPERITKITCSNGLSCILPCHPIMHKLGSGANCGPTVFIFFLRFLFVPFCMDLCKTVVASRFPLSLLKWERLFCPRLQQEICYSSLSDMGRSICQSWISNICFPVLFAASFSSLIVCVGLPWLPIWPDFLSSPACCSNDSQQTIHNYFSWSFVFGRQRKRNVALHLTPDLVKGLCSTDLTFFSSAQHQRACPLPPHAPPHPVPHENHTQLPTDVRNL